MLAIRIIYCLLCRHPMIRLYSDNSLLSPYSKGYCRLLYPAFWVSLAILFTFYVVRPIRDPDFWWHLKSGDLMIRQNGLLKIDPFNYTGDGIVRGFQAVLLYGYWLWETIASALFNNFGFNGILFLKFLTAALLIWAVLFEMSRQRLSQFTRIVLIGLGALVIVNLYHLERPQVFSFIFMTLLLGMISRIRMGNLPSSMLFPLMFIWANIHRGFVVGDILLGLATAGFLVQYRHDNRKRLLFMTWAAVGILVSFLNPNGWNTFVELFNFMQNSIGPSHVNEYRSTWQLFLLQSKMSAMSLWILSALHLAGLLLVSRRFWPEIFVSLFIIVFGLSYIRNTGFIAVSLLPMTGWYVEQAYTRLNRKVPGYARAAVCALFVAIISWLTLGEWELRRAAQSPISSCFPVNMANFLKNSGLSGHLFNDYNSGGYLDWALYPQWKTFIDGRELDTRVSDQYLKIASGSAAYAEGKPYYEFMLDRYQVDVVALAIADADGRLQPLLKLLLNQPEWVPVFLDNQSFVLARYTPQNAAAIKQYRLDKTHFLEILTTVIGIYSNSAPDSTRLSVLYADVLIYAGKLQTAEFVLKKLESSDLDPEMMRCLKNSIRS
jgi:hypothetical protein